MVSIARLVGLLLIGHHFQEDAKARRSAAPRVRAPQRSGTRCFESARSRSVHMTLRSAAVVPMSLASGCNVHGMHGMRSHVLPRQRGGMPALPRPGLSHVLSGGCKEDKLKLIRVRASARLALSNPRRGSELDGC